MDGEEEGASMAGDVNLFFNDLDDQGMCEVEVMIAEERWRRKGLAKEAVVMIMRYGEHLHTSARSILSRCSVVLFLVRGFCSQALCTAAVRYTVCLQARNKIV